MARDKLARETDDRPHLARVLEQAAARHVRVEEARMIYGREEILDVLAMTHEAWLVGAEDAVLAELEPRLREDAARLMLWCAVDPEL